MRGEIGRRFAIVVAILFILSSLVSLGLDNVDGADPVTIHIRSDGSVDPSGVNITRSGNNYTLTGDIYGNIVLERDGINLDGNGFTLRGDRTKRLITGSNRKDIHIKNFTVTNGTNGFEFYECENLKISNCTIEYNSNIGIFLSFITNGTIERNTILNNDYSGIYSISNKGLALRYNNISYNVYSGIWFVHDHKEVLIEENDLYDNTVYGIISSSVILNENITISNNYLNNRSTIYTRNGRNITIKDNTVIRSYDWALIGDFQDSLIENNTFESCDYLAGCGPMNNVSFINNRIYNISYDANPNNCFYASYLSNCNISHNYFKNINATCFSLTGVKDTIISNNTFNNTKRVIYFNGQPDWNSNLTISDNRINSSAIYIYDYNNVNVINNHITNCPKETPLNIHDSSNINVSNNILKDVISGFYSYRSLDIKVSNNTVYNCTKNLLYMPYSSHIDIYNNQFIKSSNVIIDDLNTLNENISISNNLFDRFKFTVNNARNITICNNIMSNVTETALDLENTENCVINKNVFLDSNSIVGAEFSKNITIYNNSFSNISGYGVCVYDSTNLRLFNNTFQDNSNAIYIKRTNITNVLNNSFNNSEISLTTSICEIKDNSMQNVRIRIEECSNSTIEKNTFRDGISKNAIEIHYDNYNLTISNNIFNNYTHDGIASYYSGNKNITIFGNNISDCNRYGIIFYLPNRNIEIFKNTIWNIYYSGIVIHYSEKASIKDNSISNSTSTGYGIYLTESKNASIEGNVVRDCYTGISLDDRVENCTIISNNVSNSEYIGLEVDNGKYIKMINNLIFNSTSYGLEFNDGNSPIIDGNTINGSGSHGMDLKYISNGIVCNNTVEKTDSCGMYIYEVKDSTFLNNSVTQCDNTGIIVRDNSESNIFSRNIIKNNSEHGMHISSSYNEIINNTICHNDADGIHLKSCNNTTVIDNLILENGQNGLIFETLKDSDFIRNRVEKNAVGIAFSGTGSDGNTIYHNNFVENTAQYSGISGVNTWSNGYPSGGNYWSDYDLNNGSAVDLNNDGIADSPYNFTTSIGDPYPLMKPYGLNLPFITFNSFITNRTLDIDVDINIDRDGEIVSIEWDFGDGNTGSGMYSTNEYEEDGTYNVKVTVEDDLGYVFKANKTIRIRDCPELVSNDSPDNGTTGDQFTFNISAVDNNYVEEVWIEYVHGTISDNVTLLKVGDYWLGTIYLDYTLDKLTYKIHLFDPKGEYNGTGPFNATVRDNDLPFFGLDETPLSGTTGDDFTFLMRAEDIIELDTVWVEYWYGTGIHENISLTQGITGAYYLDIIMEPTLEQLHYIFHINDSSNNWNASSERTVIIVDNDRPVFVSDETDTELTTGDEFTFKATFSDNIEVDGVWVSYRFGERSWTNLSMDHVDSTWERTFTVPLDSLDPLTYEFHAKDSSGNWEVEAGQELEVTDNDLPTFGEFTNPADSTTGDELTLNCEVLDNIQVEEVWLEYFYFGVEVNNVTMEKGTDNNWEVTTTAEHRTGYLYYIFHAVDTSGNWNQYERERVSIEDNDKPVLISDGTPSTAYTGDDVVITVVVEDNIELLDVDVEYWFGNGEKNSATMALVEGHYERSVKVPIDSLDPLNYQVSAVDKAGNEDTFQIGTVTIIDSILPSIQDIEDITIYQGESIDIEVEASDNIGIDKISWNGAPISADNDKLAGIVNVSGTFTITVAVQDEAKNSAETEFTLTVLPYDNDKDGDGMPDLWEEENGFDPEDPSDKDKDLDRDELTNYEEYLNSTDPKEFDSDGDGMPDGWEVMFGLDPLVNSSGNDEDRDGKSDFEEYSDGTDPTIPELEEEEDGGFPWLIILIFIILLIIIGIVIGLIYMRTLRNKGEGALSLKKAKDEKDMERQPSGELDLLRNKEGDGNA